MQLHQKRDKLPKFPMLLQEEKEVFFHFGTRKINVFSLQCGTHNDVCWRLALCVIDHRTKHSVTNTCALVCTYCKMITPGSISCKPLAGQTSLMMPELKKKTKKNISRPHWCMLEAIFLIASVMC